MKKFKHLKTGEIAIYQDGVLKSSGFCVEIGVEPSSEFWEEIIELTVLISAEPVEKAQPANSGNFEMVKIHLITSRRDLKKVKFNLL